MLLVWNFFGGLSSLCISHSQTLVVFVFFFLMLEDVVINWLNYEPKPDPLASSHHYKRYSIYLAGKFISISFQHEFREANFLADVLADIGHSQHPQKLFGSIPHRATIALELNACESRLYFVVASCCFGNKVIPYYLSLYSRFCVRILIPHIAYIKDKTKNNKVIQPLIVVTCWKIKRRAKEITRFSSSLVFTEENILMVFCPFSL